MCIYVYIYIYMSFGTSHVNVILYPALYITYCESPI